MTKTTFLAILIFATGISVFAQNDDISDENSDIENIADFGAQTPPRQPATPDAPRKRARAPQRLGVLGPANIRQRLDDAADHEDIRVLVNAMNVIIPMAVRGQSF